MIPAFRVKAAVRPAILKQAAACGTSIRKLTTTFNGEVAFAGYRRFNSSEVDSCIINYPHLSDTALLSRAEADMIAAYTLHELGHVLYTDNLEVSSVLAGHQDLPNRPVHKIFNGLEDPRIEAAIAANVKGGRGLFCKLRKKLVLETTDSFNPTDLRDAPFALALMGRAALGNGCPWTKGLLDRIPEPKRALYKQAIDALLGASLDPAGTAVTAQAAVRFYEGWMALKPERDAQPSPEPQQAPTGASGASDDDDLSDDMSDEMPDLLPDDDLADDLADDDFADEDDSDDLEDDEMSGEMSDEGETSGQLEELPGDDSVLSSGDDDSSDDEQAGRTDTGDFAESDDSPEIRSPEPQIDDLCSRANARERDPINLPTVNRAQYSDVSEWNFKREFTDATYARGMKAALSRGNLAALKSQLVRLFKSPEVSGWDGGAMSGRFDRRKVGQMMAGSEAIFKKRWVTEGIETAVTIIVDQSGSMDYASGKGRLDFACDVAMAIGDAAEKARCKVQILGFKDARYDQTVCAGYDHLGAYRSSHNAEQDTAMLAIYKPYNRTLSASSKQLHHMRKISGGCTPDYSACKTAVEDMALRPEGRKVVIMLTDGFGQKGAMKQLTSIAAERFGVDVVGIGIQTNPDDFRTAYAVGSCASTMEDLCGVTLREINKVLERKSASRRTM